MIEKLREHARLFPKGYIYSNTKVVVINRKNFDGYSFDRGISEEVCEYLMKSKNALFVVDLEKNLLDKIFSPDILPPEMREACSIDPNQILKVRGELNDTEYIPIEDLEKK